MKTIKNLFLLILVLGLQNGLAQNTYPPIGNMGLGTLVPTTPLEIRQNPTLDKGIKITMPGKNSIINLHLAAGENKDYGYLALGGTTKLRGSGLPSTFQGNLGIGIVPRQELDVYAANSTSEVMISSGRHDSYLKLFTKRANLNDHMHTNSGAGNQGWALIGRHLDRTHAFAGDFQIAYKGANGWKEYLTIINETGGVAIGSRYVPAGYKLSVDGKVICEELQVQLSGNWPDYVFKSDYDLKSIEEVEEYIEQENHLPGIPAASQVETEGLEVGEMQRMMMEKIEELTLYVIELNKKVKAQDELIQSLQSK